MLKPVARRQNILSDIEQLDDNMIPTLSQKYGVSEMTIRRDLQALEDTGLIRRTHGGAVRWPQGERTPDIIERERRQTFARAQKAAIARYAANELVRDGESIILEGSTTVTAMVPFLASRHGLTAMTNSLVTADELGRRLPPSATILCAGGILRPESSTFVGPLAERFFRDLHVDRLFLSATGLTARHGVTDPQILETQVKRAMIESASEVILMLDSTKWGIRSLTRVLNLAEVTTLITDDGAPAEIVEHLREQGVQVVLVQVGQQE